MCSSDLDACLDNTVIIHEYMHGISNRLTGGPNTTTCLMNAEQTSEGWSDYLALMLTTDWQVMQINNGTIPRAMGAYVSGSPMGIRTYPYSTDMLINPLTYGHLINTNGSVHKMGEIWCSALWDMTWKLIETDSINSNIENISNGGGNVIALQLVMLGMKLQPCQPGFLDARDAILKADSILFNGIHSCTIWNSFARRGMGVYAKQGSSNDYRDQEADFHDAPIEWSNIDWGIGIPTEGEVRSRVHR